MEPKVFRKASIERLSSPEQLDQLMKVTSVRSWQIIAVVGLILVAGIAWALLGTVTTTVTGQGVLIQDNISYVVNAAPGLLTAWIVKAGDSVEVGDTLATLSTPDRTDALRVVSPYRGRVALIKVQPGDYVAAGEPLLAVEGSANQSSANQGTINQGSTDTNTRLNAMLYIPLSSSGQLTAGMKVSILPSGMHVEESGYLQGTVELVSATPVTFQDILRRTGNMALSTKLYTGDDLVEVRVMLDTDNTNNSVNGGYSWSLPQRSLKVLTFGMLCSGNIITSQQAPIQLVFARPVQPSSALPQNTPLAETKQP